MREWYVGNNTGYPGAPAATAAIIGSGTHRISVSAPPARTSSTGGRQFWIRQVKIWFGSTSSNQVRLGVGPAAGGATTALFTAHPAPSGDRSRDTTFRSLDVGNGHIQDANASGTFQLGFNTNNPTNYFGTTSGSALAQLWWGVRWSEVPNVPRSVSISGGSQSVTVSWLSPNDDGGDPISGYRVEISTSPGFSSVHSFAEVTGTSHTFTGLTAGTNFWARVYAFNGLRTRFSSTPMSPVSTINGPATVQSPPRPPPAFITTSPLPSITIGGTLNTQLSASNTDQFGSLGGSPWISVSSAGLLTGTAPLAAGPYSISVRASSLTGFQDRTFAITVNGVTPTWSTGQNLPNASNGGQYQATVSASASPASVTYSLVSRSNTWVNVSASGVISGQASGINQTTTITVRATSNGLTADRTFSILVVASAPTPVWITDSQLPRAKSGIAYSTSVSAQNATSYQLTGNPGWFTFNSSTGVLSGTPPAIASITFYPFSVIPVNSEGTPGPSRTFSITADPPSPAWTKSALSVTEVVINNNYTDGFVASNVRATSGYSITGLPDGLSFNSNTGVIFSPAEGDGRVGPRVQGSFTIRATAFGLDGTTITTESILNVFFPGKITSPLGQQVVFRTAARWSGTTWVSLERVRRWNGSAWVDVSN